jgi:hypothetical protein
VYAVVGFVLGPNDEDVGLFEGEGLFAKDCSGATMYRYKIGSITLSVSRVSPLNMPYITDD